jgi:hypothetical protein
MRSTTSKAARRNSRNYCSCAEAPSGVPVGGVTPALVTAGGIAFVLLAAKRHGLPA